MSSALVSLNANSHMGAGTKRCALAIVPVKIKLEKGTKIVQTYAFLDEGSSATFCTEALMHQLNANGKKMDILLKTMGQNKPVSSHKISGLEVAALKSDTFIKLPDVYTHKSIPITKENIPKEEDIRKLCLKMNRTMKMEKCGLYRIMESITHAKRPYIQYLIVPQPIVELL